jgi:hypothetical protein
MMKMLNQEYQVTTKGSFESTQIGYQNNESFKKALRWAIEMTKMSKLRILSNNKGVVQGSTQVGY